MPRNHPSDSLLYFARGPLGDYSDLQKHYRPWGAYAGISTAAFFSSDQLFTGRLTNRHNFQIQALVSTLGTVSAVASPADMLTAFTLSSILSKPDVSVQVLSSAAEGNTTVDDFVTKAQVISSGNKEDNTAALGAQPEYCPNDYENTPMCADCGGFTLLYYKELDYYDTRCKGVGVDEYLKDCPCLERRYQEDDDIVCDIFAPDPDPDPDATMRSALEAIALVPDNISYPFIDTESDNDFWLAVPDNMGQSDDEQEDECLPKEGI